MVLKLNTLINTRVKEKMAAILEYCLSTLEYRAAMFNSLKSTRVSVRVFVRVLAILEYGITVLEYRAFKILLKQNSSSQTRVN